MISSEDALTNPSAAFAAATDKAPESPRGTLKVDLRHVGRLLWMYIKADKIIGPLLILCQLVPTVGAAVVFMQMQVSLAGITNALVDKNVSVIPGLTTLVVVLSLAGLAVGVLTRWTSYVLRIRFRSVVTANYLDRWLASDRYYHLERRANLDHPEQRIQEDVFQFMEQLLEIAPMLLNTVTALVLYSGQLYSLSPPVNFGFIGIPQEIPGFLLYFALGLSILWTVLTHWIGRTLTRIEVVRQRLEAQFRHQMAGVRENGESIAFARAAGAEGTRLTSTFSLIRQNWRHYTFSNIKIMFFGGIPETILTLAPPLLAIPYVLSGQMKVGDIALLTVSLRQVYNAIGIFVVLYGQLAIFRSSVARLRLMDDLLSFEPKSDIKVTRGRDNAIEIRGLAIAFPDGSRMTEVGNLDIAPGKNLLIQGPSGAGKSTLLRSIAGLWPFGSGEVDLPSDARVAFLPQRAYMPDGTLASLMAYPDIPGRHSDATYIGLMERLGLGHLTSSLHEHGAWHRILSGGEQQRIAAIRAVLARPDYLFLDEATSALDPKSEERVYKMLTDELHDTAIVSVAHREAVAQYHDQRLVIDQGVARSPATA
ncbi:MAG: ATP-binding cassette domain-containing protein [Sphingopyxis sp.]|nr:ATP-binding cassette domain-containing protein [Sphingopyxis sp.]